MSIIRATESKMWWLRILVLVLALPVTGPVAVSWAQVPSKKPVRPVPAVKDEDAVTAGEEAEGAEEAEDLEWRVKFFESRHLDLQGRFVPDGLTRAFGEMEKNIKVGLLRDGRGIQAYGSVWSSIGPFMMGQSSPYPTHNGGRVTSIAIHPTNANIAYIGSSNGGVWKTTDHGVSWTPLTDAKIGSAIGSVAIAPSNANIIYAGTGEGNLSGDSYYGVGILKTIDGGTTWNVVGGAQFSNTAISKIVVDPGNANIVWVTNVTGCAGAFTQCLPAAGQLGVWKSIDGGTSWSLVKPFANGVSDLVLYPTNSSTAFAAMIKDGIYITKDGGATWDRENIGTPPASAIGRLAIAIDPVVVSTMYAVFADVDTGGHYGTYKSTDSGATWAAVTKPTSGTCAGAALSDICSYTGDDPPRQCWYDLTIGVDPSRDVWIGGIGIFRSADGGDHWSSVCANYVHVDQHALAFRGTDVWVGNDGGVFTTADDGATWTIRNVGLAIAQFYPGGTVHPFSSGNYTIGGTQDNGTVRSNPPSLEWITDVGGDGTAAAYDPNFPDTTWYVSNGKLAISKTTDGGASFSAAWNGLPRDSANGLAPFAVCPRDARVVIAGNSSVWLSQDGTATWTAPTGWGPIPAGEQITALAFHPANCNIYYAGTNTGRVFGTHDYGASWNVMTGTLPAQVISDIAVDGSTAQRVVVTHAGFGTQHVYLTNNAFNTPPTWTGIGAGIPNAPVNAVVIGSSWPTLYLGTDVGMYRSTDGGTTWTLLMNGHPFSPIHGLRVRQNGAVVSFTHGRGAFQLDAPCDDGNACTVDVNDPIAGCGHYPTRCVDLDMCTNDSCVPATGCVFTPTLPAACNDNDPCTTDTCQSNECLHTSNTASCNDNNACTTGDVCKQDYADSITTAAGWSVTGTTWFLSSNEYSSPPAALVAWTPTKASDSYIVTPAIVLPTGQATLTFKNRYLLDANRTGTVLEIYVNNAWHDILQYGSFQSDGYTGTLTAGGPLNGRQAFTGTSIGFPKFMTTSVLLTPSLSGQTVYFGWRAASINDGNLGGEFVLDDVVIAARSTACGGTPVLPSYCDDANVCTDDSCNTINGCVHAANTAPCSLGTCTLGDTCSGGVCVAGTIPAPPAPVNTLQEDHAILSWTAVPGATGYDVVRGNLELLRGSQGDFTASTMPCLTNDTSYTSIIDAATPGPGTGYYYLVRATNCDGSGTYDSGSPSQVGSRDAEVDAAAFSCTTACTRDKCMAGTVGDAQCGGCFQTVCNADSFCCTFGWDATCVSEVRTLCNSLTCPQSAGACAHPVCTIGSPLVPGCDDPPVSPSCVSAICAVDSVCCSTNWDNFCTSEVESICGYNCN